MTACGVCLRIWCVFGKLRPVCGSGAGIRTKFIADLLRDLPGPVRETRQWIASCTTMAYLNAVSTVTMSLRLPIQSAARSASFRARVPTNCTRQMLLKSSRSITSLCRARRPGISLEINARDGESLIKRLGELSCGANTVLSKPNGFRYAIRS